MMESSRKYSKENRGEGQEASTSPAKLPKMPFDVTRQGLAQEQEDSSGQRQKASTSSGMDLTRQGSSDLGRECPEMKKQLDQMRSEMEERIGQMKLESQKNPKTREEVLTQWWKMQRENKMLLDQMQQKTAENPKIRKQITEQWWEMHRQDKIQLDNQMQKAGENPEM